MRIPLLSMGTVSRHAAGVVLTTIILSMSAPGQAGKSLIINHFVSDPTTIEGHLVVADVEGTGGTVKISFYDENGNLEGYATETIPPHGKINLNPEKYVKGKKMIGTIRISATKAVAGQYWQFYHDKELGWKNIAVPAAVGPGTTKLICQHFVSDPNIESYIVVANSDDQSTTVHVELYSDDGVLAGQTKLIVPGNGKLRIIPYGIVGGRKMTGVATVQSEGAFLTGEYWQVSENEKYQIAHAMLDIAPDAEALAEMKLMRVMINFDFDSDRIQSRSFADLAEVAKAMNLPKNKNVKYEIAGFTDDQGSRDYNIKLSERRAKSVRDYLVKNGKVSPKRLIVKGYGPDNPIVPNSTELNRARNRRVEFRKL
ncbi:MAG: OmpA family protein [Bacteroidota bacterium]|nr:OmpA family protein [Bacteroidota bacterium]